MSGYQNPLLAWLLGVLTLVFLVYTAIVWWRDKWGPRMIEETEVPNAQEVAPPPASTGVRVIGGYGNEVSGNKLYGFDNPVDVQHSPGTTVKNNEATRAPPAK